jgi:hypothetical protein
MDPNEDIRNMNLDQPYRDRIGDVRLRNIVQTTGDVVDSVAMIPLLNNLRSILILLNDRLDEISGESLIIIARYIVFMSMLREHYYFLTVDGLSRSYDKIENERGEMEKSFEHDSFLSTLLIIEAEILLILGKEALIEVFNMEHYPGLK